MRVCSWVLFGAWTVGLAAGERDLEAELLAAQRAHEVALAKLEKVHGGLEQAEKLVRQKEDELARVRKIRDDLEAIHSESHEEEVRAREALEAVKKEREKNSVEAVEARAKDLQERARQLRKKARELMGE